MGTVYSGNDVARLEEEMSSHIGVADAVAMPMARVGIYAALCSLIRPGQTVIMSPYTIADVVNMVVAAGGRPVFADVDRNTCNIDPDRIAELIDDRTGAILATHFYGLMCDMPRIVEIAEAAGIPVIEDAAQAFGARQGNRLAGSIGTVGIFSFGLYKSVSAFRGGMVVSDDKALVEKIRDMIEGYVDRPSQKLMIDVAKGFLVDLITAPVLFSPVFFRMFRTALLRNWEFINRRLKIDLNPSLNRSLPAKYQYKLAQVQARLIQQNFGDASSGNQHRIRTAQKYHEGLVDLPDLILPPLCDDGSHVYWYYPIQYTRRGELVAYAARHGRDIAASYHRNCAEMSCFAEFAGDCPNARETAASVIYLPTYPRYDDREVELTIRTIRDFFGC